MKIVHLIDDDKDFRDILEIYIKNHFSGSIEIKTFENAYDFYDFMKTNKEADIIICDYEMPGMNGVDLYFQLKNENMIHNSKCYLLSAYITHGFPDVQDISFLSKRSSIQETIKSIL